MDLAQPDEAAASLGAAQAQGRTNWRAVLLAVLAENQISKLGSRRDRVEWQLSDRNPVRWTIVTYARGKLSGTAHSIKYHAI